MVSERPEWWPRFEVADQIGRRGDLPGARSAIFNIIAETAHDPDAPYTESFLMQALGRMEASVGNRSGFEQAYARVFELHPAAPYPRLSYAREVWTGFADAERSSSAIEDLRAILATWEPRPDEPDLSRRAYERKVEALEQWMGGTPPSPEGIWP